MLGSVQAVPGEPCGSGFNIVTVQGWVCNCRAQGRRRRTGASAEFRLSWSFFNVLEPL